MLDYSAKITNDICHDVTLFVKLYGKNLKIHKVNPPALNQTTSRWSWEPLSFPPSFFLHWILAMIPGQLTFHWSSRTPSVPPFDLCSTEHAMKPCTCCREEPLALCLACLQWYLSTWVMSGFAIWRGKVRGYGKIMKKVKAEWDY